jgi:hypothetical protein
MHSLMINDDIDAIIQCGEERTVELNSKYEGLNSDDLNNFNRTPRFSGGKEKISDLG